MLATLGGRPQGRDTKAELNRRSQACDVLTGTGISRRVNGGRVGALRRPDAAARRLCQKWTSLRVARPVFRFGRPACISQHPCSLESRAGIAAFAVLQTAACAARPTRRKLKARASAFALARVVCQLHGVLE